MRRLLLLATGVLLAFLAGCCVLILALLAESLAVPASTSLVLFDIAALILAGLRDGTAGRLVGSGLEAIWLALVLTCFGPVCLVALLGEAVGLRSLVWSAGATGAVTAAVPTLLRGVAGLPVDSARHAEEGRITLILFLTGVAAGLVHWGIAGRGNVAQTTHR